MLSENDIKLLTNIGKKIKQKRKELNLSQEILSFDADIPRNQVGRIERGEINPTIVTLKKICNALSIDLKELFN